MFSKLLTIRLFGQCLYPIIVYVLDYSFRPGISDVKPPPPVPTCDRADPPVASSIATRSKSACISQTCLTVPKQR